MTAVIETRGLTKDFGAGRGILDLDLDVQEGEVFGFLGPNGAGKTTTIRLLLDQLRPTRGEARVLGMHPRRDALHLRRVVGYLPGDLALYPRLTGRQVLRHFGAMHRDIDDRHVRALIDRLRIDLDARIGRLSSGNRQKLGLLLALQHQPELLILDEPTAGLDPLMQREVHALIREAASDGRSVFLSSHVLPEVERVCDRVAIIREARLLVTRRLDDIRRGENRLVFTFDREVPHGHFDGLPGVRFTAYEGRRARVAVDGPVHEVLAKALELPVLDVDSADPDLEEVFMRYYQGVPDAEAARHEGAPEASHA